MEINMKLEQDEMEGVDSKEWVSSISIGVLALIKTPIPLLVDNLLFNIFKWFPNFIYFDFD